MELSSFKETWDIYTLQALKLRTYFGLPIGNILNCVPGTHYSYVSYKKIQIIIIIIIFFLGRRTTTMPSMQMFGRRWLAGTDDLVFPGLLELLMRGIWWVIWIENNYLL